MPGFIGRDFPERAVQQIVGRERRERVSQLAWCGEGCFDSRRRVNSTVGALSKPMRFLLPIICIVTFCMVSVMVVDAVMPFGFILMRLLKDEPTPTAVRVLLLVPFAGTIISSLVNHTFIRSILTSASVFLLIVLWMLGLVLFVVYPMPDTP